ATGATYTTPATTAGDPSYRVVVTNTVGSVTSATATLTILSGNTPPTITTQPLNQTVATGQAATFTAGATGTAPLAFPGYRNGVRISGASAASYTTPAATAGGSGSVYRGVVTNPVSAGAGRAGHPAVGE